MSIHIITPLRQPREQGDERIHPAHALTRVVASFAMPPGWLRKASLGWSPSKLNGSGIFCGSFVNIFKPSILVVQTTGGSPEDRDKWGTSKQVEEVRRSKPATDCFGPDTGRLRSQGGGYIILSFRLSCVVRACRADVITTTNVQKLC